jgi:hypothetical protein
LVDKLVAAVQAVYEPGRHIILDESMILFRGRLKFHQYLPGEAHKYGIKLYKLCTPEAYTLNVIVHLGSTAPRYDLSSTKSLTVAICDKIVNKGSTLYADNYYSSVSLAEWLLKKKMYFCGTVRKNGKHLANKITRSKLKNREMKAAQNSNGVKLYNWRERRNVLTISTVPEHGQELIATEKETGMAMPF